MKDGQQAFFEDQFRRGSYIYLEEVLTPEQVELFETSWTMYDDSVPVTFFNTGNTVVNPASSKQYLVAVAGTKVDDGRKEVYQTGTEQGKTIENSGYTATAYPKDSSRNTQPAFVFRSYKTPDAVKSSTKLTAKFTNTVRTGTLTLSKATAEGSDSLGTEKFKFYIVFKDVGGLDLEGSNSIVKEVELSAGQSETITGIPVNTQYTIYEMKSTDTTISLSKVTVNGEEITAADARYATTAPAPYDSKSISGKIALSGTSGETDTVVFYNTKSAKTSLEFTKVWANGLPTDAQTENISFQLQRRQGDNGTWNAVEVPAKDITKGVQDNYWMYKYSNLDKTGTDEEGKPFTWQYRVVELYNGVEVGHQGIAGDFKVTYEYTETVNNAIVAGPAQESNTVLAQSITNTLREKIKITVEKVWQNDLATSAGGNKMTLPESVKVMLMRKSAAPNAAWENVFQAPVFLSDSTDWKHDFGEHFKADEAGYEYTYVVRELQPDTNSAILPSGSLTVNGAEYEVTYTSATDAENSNQTNWTITNTIVPKVQMKVLKAATDGGNIDTSQVLFKLEKYHGSTNTWTIVKTQNNQDTFGPDFTFTGLTNDVYRLTEIQTAPGYSLLAEPITIVITDNRTSDGTKSGIYTAKVNSADTGFTFSANSEGVYTLEFTVYNKPQLQMPATGGVGGFEFWILGGLLIMAVPLLMYTFIWYRKGGKYLQR